MAYQDTLSELLAKDKQNKLQGGMGLDPLQLEGALGGIYSAEASRAETQREAMAREKFMQEQLNMEQAAAKRQNISSMIGGVAQLGTGLASAGAFNPGGIFGKGGAVSNLFGGGATAGMTGAAAGDFAGSLGYTGGMGADALGGLYSGSPLAMTGAYSPGAAITGAEAATDTGLLGTGVAGSTLTGAGLGALGGSLLGGAIGGKTGKEIGGVLGGAAMGFGLGGPVGGIIGGVLGAVGDVLGGGSVICTELHRQGLLDGGLFEAEKKYIDKYISVGTYLGYRYMADDVVDVMRGSRGFTKAIAPFVRAFAQECSHRGHPEKYKGSLLGKFILWAGVPLCDLVWKHQVHKSAKSMGVI